MMEHCTETFLLLAEQCECRSKCFGLGLQHTGEVSGHALCIKFSTLFAWRGLLELGTESCTNQLQLPTDWRCTLLL
jgi:hypothetical protein